MAMPNLEIGDSVLANVDGESPIGTIVALSPRIVTVRFHGGTFGHAKQTFERKTGLPTGQTALSHASARLDTGWRSPHPDEAEKARLQRAYAKPPKAAPAPKAPAFAKAAPSPSVEFAWPIVAERNGLAVYKREDRTNGVRYGIAHRSSGLSLGPIGPYPTRREALAVLDALAPLFDWTVTKEEMAAMPGADALRHRQRILDAAKSALLNLPTLSTKPWQVSLLVIDPALPDARQQRRVTVPATVAKTGMEAAKEAVRGMAAAGLEYVDTLNVYQGY